MCLGASPVDTGGTGELLPFLGFYRGLSALPASAPSSLCPCLLRRTPWHGKGLLRALTLPKRSRRTTAPLCLATGISRTRCLGAGMVRNAAGQSLPAQRRLLPPSTCNSPARLPCPSPRVLVAKATYRRYLRNFATVTARPSPCSFHLPARRLPRGISHRMLYLEKSPSAMPR